MNRKMNAFNRRKERWARQVRAIEEREKLTTSRVDLTRLAFQLEELLERGRAINTDALELGKSDRTMSYLRATMHALSSISKKIAARLDAPELEHDYSLMTQEDYNDAKEIESWGDWNEG